MPATPARRNEENDMHVIKTVREADKIAKALGFTRGKGTYNGAPYWLDSLGRIVTRDRLAELAGLV
jgi:hypothetical protein